MLRKILVALAGLLGIAIAGFAIYVAARQHLTFDAPYPHVRASTESGVIARGHYLVRVAANCTICHGDPAQLASTMTGAEVPLSGGFYWAIPPGTFYARNITPDSETGIGRIADSAIARALRYGVGHDGRALLPFMEFQAFSDEDLVAVISYLRSQPPVRNVVPPHRWTMLGRVVRATVLANPVGPKQTPPVTSPRGATVENGRYLAEAAVHCVSCHTERNLNTGTLTGPPYGGATVFKEESDPGHVWAPPNITSDPETGRLGRMSEDEFLARFRVGRLLPGSPMPWQGFQKMPDEDLRAIYRFLKTVPAVRRDVGPPVRDAK
jgi:mono/diheme cytochrome c family protein